jgi:hypothetical protein
VFKHSFTISENGTKFYEPFIAEVLCVSITWNHSIRLEYNCFPVRMCLLHVWTCIILDCCVSGLVLLFSLPTEHNVSETWSVPSDELVRRQLHRQVWCQSMDLVQFLKLCVLLLMLRGSRGSVVGWGTMLQAGRSRVRVPMRWIFFFNLPIPSSHSMALGSTQPLTEMSTWNLPGA